MLFIDYLSNAIIPIIITIILLIGIKERVKIFDTFLEGATEGAMIAIKLLPTLVGVFVAIGCLRSSGVIDFLVTIIEPITNFLKIPKEIMPLALIRPISR